MEFFCAQRSGNNAGFRQGFRQLSKIGGSKAFPSGEGGAAEGRDERGTVQATGQYSPGRIQKAAPAALPEKFSPDTMQPVNCFFVRKDVD